MSAPQPAKPREWPKFAIGPNKQRARFDCRAEVLCGWIIEGESEPANVRTRPPKDEPAKVKKA